MTATCAVNGCSSTGDRYFHHRNDGGTVYTFILTVIALVPGYVVYGKIVDIIFYPADPGRIVPQRYGLRPDAYSVRQTVSELPNAVSVRA